MQVSDKAGFRQLLMHAGTLHRHSMGCSNPIRNHLNFNQEVKWSYFLEIAIVTVLEAVQSLGRDVAGVTRRGREEERGWYPT